MPFGQRLRPSDERIRIPGSDNQAEGLQHAADLGVELETDENEPVASGKQRTPLVSREALDLHLPVPAHAHHLCQAARIAAVRLHRPNRESGMSVPGIHGTALADLRP